MTQLKSGISLTARWLALIISLFIIFLGACIVIDEYAPGRYTRFGYAEALSGVKAKEFAQSSFCSDVCRYLFFAKIHAKLQFLAQHLASYSSLRFL